MNKSASRELDKIYRDDGRKDTGDVTDGSEEPVDISSLLIKFAELTGRVSRLERQTKDVKSENSETEGVP